MPGICPTISRTNARIHWKVTALTAPYCMCIEENNFRACDDASGLRGRPNRQARKLTTSHRISPKQGTQIRRIACLIWLGDDETSIWLQLPFNREYRNCSGVSLLTDCDDGCIKHGVHSSFPRQRRQGQHPGIFSLAKALLRIDGKHIRWNLIVPGGPLSSSKKHCRGVFCRNSMPKRTMTRLMSFSSW